ncbi:hypothetical protein CerSpe_259210 [Prunus speciosa]
MASPPSLPSEIWFDHILTRIESLDSLGMCRVVSKDWNHITYESRFWKLFCMRSDTVHSGFLIQTSHNGKHSSTFVSVDNKANKTLNLPILNFLPAPVKVEAVSSQGGLVFCLNQNHRRVPEYFVCKPTTLQWETLPNPKTRYTTLSNAIVVLSSKPLRYKIIRFSKPVKCNPQPYKNLITCEVFDSNTREWKQLKHVSLPDSVFFNLRHCVTSCGACYWLLTNNQVLAFYYEDDKESWELFDSPESVSDSDWSKYNKLVEYQGRLALMYFEGELMELWVMEDHEKKVWRRHKVISLKGLKELEGHDYAYIFPVAHYSSDIALMKGLKQVSFYKFQGSSSYKVVKLEHKPNEIFKLQSDFEKVNLRGPWRWRDFSFIFFVFGFSLFCYFVRFVLGL